MLLLFALLATQIARKPSVLACNSHNVSTNIIYNVATFTSDLSRCFVGDQQSGVKPKGSVKELNVIRHISSFRGNASDCARACCNLSTCTSVWLLKNICVMLDCSEEDQIGPCSTVSTPFTSYVVNVVRNKGVLKVLRGSGLNTFNYVFIYIFN